MEKIGYIVYDLFYRDTGSYMGSLIDDYMISLAVWKIASE